MQKRKLGNLEVWPRAGLHEHELRLRPGGCQAGEEVPFCNFLETNDGAMKI